MEIMTFGVLMLEKKKMSNLLFRAIIAKGPFSHHLPLLRSIVIFN